MPNAVVYILWSIPLSLSVVLEVMKVLDMDLNFQENANSFLFIPGTTQMQLIYFCLAFQNDLISESVKQIQETVDRSKFSHLILILVLIVQSLFQEAIHLINHFQSIIWLSLAIYNDRHLFRLSFHFVMCFISSDN